MQSNQRTRVIIVGGGFAGINAAKILARDPDTILTVIDRRNHHLFQPLLYQVATAGLSPAEIATPIRAILGHHENCETYLAEVQAVDLANNLVKTDFRDFSYDYLILACGAQHSYFGRNDWEKSAPGLKTLEQAREIRRRIFLAFELAEREENEHKREELLTFVVVGAGPTGVELAGTLGEISRFALSREFRHIDPRSTRIILVEAGDRILPSFSLKSSERALSDLKALGVDVWTKHKVTNIYENGIDIDGKPMRASTVLWAAGVKPSRLCKTLNVDLDNVGRVIIEKDLSLKDFPNVFVLGDMAHCKNSDNKPLPGVAAVAIQQGRATARNIVRDIAKKPRVPFHYINKGQMATIGRSRAILEWGPIRIGGIIAWLGWLLVHIYYLIGFKNRVIVMLQWAFSFFSYRRGARLIQSKNWWSVDE